MKTAYFIVLQFLTVTGYCQTFSVRFDSGGWPVDDAGYSIEKTANGFFLSCGTLNASASDQQLSFVGLSDLGEVMWMKVYGDPNETDYSGWANSMNRVNDSLFVQGCSHGDEPMAVLIKNDGDTIWIVKEITTLIKPLYNGISGWNEKLILVGFLDISESELRCGLVQNYCLDGSLHWEKTYSGSNYGISFQSAVKTPDFGYLFSGYTTGIVQDNEIDLLILKTDSLGNEQWRKRWGDWDDGIAFLANPSDGNYAVCSWAASEYELNNFHPPRPYMAKLDTDGDIIWERWYGGYNLPTYLTKIIETQDGNYVAAGLRSVAGEERGLIIKADAQTGDSLWYRVYAYADNVDEPFDCMFRDIIETEDGSLVACGYVDPTPGYPSRDTWVMKVDSMGCLVPGCDVGILENEQHANFLCYPNPASQYLNIYLESQSFDLRSSRFNLYNLNGELVRCFEPDENKTTYMLDVSALTAGCYILQYLEDDGIFATRRINVVH